jgi:hypothetical protein
MFKSVFDWVEKLINEHGSSAIKNERLALKDEQIATLEKQLSEWKTAAEAAKAVARIFETENGRLRVEIQRKHDEMDPSFIPHRQPRIFILTREKYLIKSHQPQNNLSCRSSGSVSANARRRSPTSVSTESK